MESLLHIFETVRGIADALGAPYQTVVSWNDRGVPLRRYRQLREAARKKGYDLKIDHLTGDAVGLPQPLAKPKAAEDAA